MNPLDKGSSLAFLHAAADIGARERERVSWIFPRFVLWSWVTAGVGLFGCFDKRLMNDFRGGWMDGWPVRRIDTPKARVFAGSGHSERYPLLLMYFFLFNLLLLFVSTFLVGSAVHSYNVNWFHRAYST